MHEGKLDGGTQPSHVHRLVGSKNRNYANMVTKSEHNQLYVDKLEGHVNFIYDPNDEGGDTEDPSYQPPTKIYNGLTQIPSGVAIFILQVQLLVQQLMCTLLNEV